MDPVVAGRRYGLYRVVRRLPDGPRRTRALALHDRRRTTHTVCAVGLTHALRRRFVDAVQRIASVRSAHLLPIEEFSIAARDEFGLIVTPYTGSQLGLVTLGGLLDAKGGRFSVPEASRAIEQLLAATAAAHELGLAHGTLGAEEILVDRRGRLVLELYGLWAQLMGEPGDVAELAPDEVRSIASIGYRLITGLPADAPRVDASRVVRRLDREWDEWLAHGLDPVSGFASASEALESLPGRVRRGAAWARGAGSLAPTAHLTGAGRDA